MEGGDAHPRELRHLLDPERLGVVVPDPLHGAPDVRAGCCRPRRAGGRRHPVPRSSTARGSRACTAGSVPSGPVDGRAGAAAARRRRAVRPGASLTAIPGRADAGRPWQIPRTGLQQQVRDDGRFESHPEAERGAVGSGVHDMSGHRDVDRGDEVLTGAGSRRSGHPAPDACHPGRSPPAPSRTSRTPAQRRGRPCRSGHRRSPWSDRDAHADPAGRGARPETCHDYSIKAAAIAHRQEDRAKMCDFRERSGAPDLLSQGFRQALASVRGPRGLVPDIGAWIGIPCGGPSTDEYPSSSTRS